VSFREEPSSYSSFPLRRSLSVIPPLGEGGKRWGREIITTQTVNQIG